MLYSCKKCKIGLAAMALMLLLQACGGKQPTVPEVAVVEPLPMDKMAESLTPAEVSALKSTGQIDRHLPDHAMPDVAAQYRHFLRKGRDTMCSLSRRSEQYLAYARKVFRDRGMPEELANLAIIESGYRPNAVSRAGAAGAWQFMPDTGQHYGLTQDWWQDERLDPYRATEAAAEYLQKLYNDFGDWPTAIAAYNAGEGKMSRAKAGTGARDFFEVTARNETLDEKTQLREETKQYVPRFMAVTKIMRNLPKLGFEPIDPENAEPVLRLSARPGTDLRAFSKACNLSWSEFAKYNQHHKRVITCTDRVTFVYVPSRVRREANAFLCANTQADYAGWKPTKIARNGDSLEKISRRSQISLAMLQAVNPGVSKLNAGQTILAPAHVKLSPKTAKIIATAYSGQKNPKTESHVLKNNETLYAVAKKYKTTVAALTAHNGIKDPAKLKSGHVLHIPGAGKPVSKGSSGSLGKRKATYTVQARDNLWSIAKRHKVSVDDLRRWNAVAAKSLKPGATLVVSQ